MLINALQTKCSPFSLFGSLLHSPPLPISLAFWVVIAEWDGGGGAGGRGGELEGSTRTKQNMRRSTLVGFDNAEPSHCLPAAVSVWCWERSIYSTQSYASDCLTQTTYITHQLHHIQRYEKTGPLPGTPGCFYSNTHFTHKVTWMRHKPSHRLQVLSFYICRIYQKIPTVFIHNTFCYMHSHTHTHKCLHNCVTRTESHRISVVAFMLGPNVILIVQLKSAESVITLYESVLWVCVKVAV